MDLLPVWIVTNIKGLDQVKNPHFFEEASEEYVLILKYYSEYNCFMSCLEKQAWGTLIPITHDRVKQIATSKDTKWWICFSKIKIEKEKWKLMLN